MALIPSLRRALARLLGGDETRGHVDTQTRGQADIQTRGPSPRPRLPVSPLPGQLISVGDCVIFATNDREAERALLLTMEGANEELRRACHSVLLELRGREAAAA